jgi:hypothetical protein
MRVAAALFSMAFAATALGQSITLRGVATDSATRRPVNGVIVELAGDTKRYTTRSDEAGEFQVSNVEPGVYRLVTRRIGYSPRTRSVVVVSGMKSIAIPLAPIPQALRAVQVRGEGMGIYGEVGASSDLKLIPGAMVQVAGAAQTTVTDSVGSYFVPVTRPGTYMVRVKARGFADEMFMVEVSRDQVADGTRLLDAADETRSIPEGLWKDFDQRLRWRSNNSAVVGGADARHAGASLQDAIESSVAVKRRGLRLGPTVCVMVNGAPRPGLPLDAIRPEEVAAIEVYANDREVLRYLGMTWIGQCSETGRKVKNPRAPEIIKYVVIWTR